MRARLYREGVVTTDGRLLLNTTWRREPIPLLIIPVPPGEGHSGSTPIGKVTDLRREYDGWVTGELWTEDERDLTGLACEADFDSADFAVAELNDESSLMVTTGARLSGVHIGFNPCWAGMRIE